MQPMPTSSAAVGEDRFAAQMNPLDQDLNRVCKLMHETVFDSQGRSTAVMAQGCSLHIKSNLSISSTLWSCRHDS